MKNNTLHFYKQSVEQYFHLDSITKTSQQDTLRWIVEELSNSKSLTKNQLYVQLGYRTKLINSETDIQNSA